MEKRKAKEVLVLFSIICLALLFNSNVVAQECNEYYVIPKDTSQSPRLTSICDNDGKPEINNVELEKSDDGVYRIEGYEIAEVNANQSESNASEASDEEAESSAAEQTASADSEAPDENAASGEAASSESESSDANAASEEDTSSEKEASSTESAPSEDTEKLRDGSATDRIKYVAIKCCEKFLSWVSKNWSDFLLLLLASAALLFAALAWRSSRKEVKENKKLHAIQQRPYFEFVSASMRWATNVPYFKPYVSCILRIKNIGQSVAIDLQHPRVTQCNVRFDEHTTSIDTEKYESSLDVIVAKSLEINDMISEDSIREFFPAEQISRRVINPNETVDIMILVPLKEADSKIDAEEMIADPWALAGSFSFTDAFGGTPRTCDFVVHLSQDNMAGLGDGTAIDLGMEGKIGLAGKITEQEEKPIVPAYNGPIRPKKVAALA